MEINEFITQLEEAAQSVQVQWIIAGGCIRTSDYQQCPITFLARQRFNVPEISLNDYERAAGYMGLSIADANDIVHAADFHSLGLDEHTHRPLRLRILGALHIVAIR